MLGRNKKGQVAVEFIITFSIVIILFILLYRFSISLAQINLHQYITFMGGRAAASGTSSYSVKASNVESTISTYLNANGANLSSLVKNFKCINETGEAHQRGNLAYFRGEVNYSIGSNAGIACSFSISPIINEVKLVSEAFIGSDISSAHCKCLLDYKNTWRDCLGEGSATEKSAISDNGC